MAYNLLITQNADDELAGIIDYIANHLDNPKAAGDFLDRAETCYENLTENPKMYLLCDHQDFKEKGYHKVIIKNYVLLFRIDEDTDTVYILHVFFGRQDYYSMI